MLRKRGFHSAGAGIRMSMFPESERIPTGRSRSASRHSSKEPAHPVERSRIVTEGLDSLNVALHQAFVCGQADGLGSSDSETDHVHDAPK